MRMRSGVPFAALGTFALSAAAQAAITPTLIAVNDHGDGTYTYVYNVDLAADQSAVPDGLYQPSGTTPTEAGSPSNTFKDYFTIYDFAGLVADSWTQPAGWAPSISLVGPTPSTTAPADDPNLINFTWFRDGSAITGPADLGNFSLRSVFPVTALESYTSDATANEGSSAGTAVASIGTVLVPDITIGGPCPGGSCPVSEPGTLMVVAGGLIGLGLRRLKNR